MGAQVRSISSRQLGLILVLVSALVFSTAGIFTKGVTTDAIGIIFWRGLAAAAFTWAWLALKGQVRSEIRAFRGPALMVAILSAIGTAAFIPAFKLTSVANVALIYATAPMVAAALAWLFLGERPNRAVLAASAAAFVGVAIVVSGSFGGGSLMGDFLALVMTAMMAGVFVVYRRWPDTTAAMPAIAASLVLAIYAIIVGEPLAAPVAELPIHAAFGLVFAVASVTLAEGARRLPPDETALLSTLEMPFAPIWAFLMLAEIPATATIVGGLVIMCAVLASQAAQRQR